MQLLGILFIIAVICFIPAEYRRYKEKKEYKRFWEERAFRYYLTCRQKSGEWSQDNRERLRR